MTTTNTTAFLQNLIGQWSYRLAATDASEAPGFTSQGTETVRAISEHWVALENTGAGSDGDASRQVTLLGFDPAKGRFGGAVATTATPALFIYDGELADDGQSLPLETEGPAMMGGEGVDRYRDIFQTHDENRRSVTSQVRNAEGEWQTFMRADYTRVS